MMTRRVALLVGSSLALPVFADTPMTSIRVEVTNDIGKPVDRAGVVVKFIKGRSAAKLGKKIIKSWEMRTNSDGWVKIPPIPQGEILIQVIARNYQTFGETFDVTEEERTIQVKLSPPQKQYSTHSEAAEPKKP